MPILLNEIPDDKWSDLKDSFRDKYRTKFEWRLQWAADPDQVFNKVFERCFQIAKAKLLQKGTIEEFRRLLGTVLRNKLESERRSFTSAGIRIERIIAQFIQAQKDIRKTVDQVRDFRLRLDRSDFGSPLGKSGRHNGARLVQAISNALAKEEHTLGQCDFSTPSSEAEYQRRLKVYRGQMRGRNDVGIQPIVFMRISRKEFPDVPQTAWDQMKRRFFDQDLILLQRQFNKDKEKSETLRRLQSRRKSNCPKEAAW